jgi:hypothetical protein
MKLSQLAREPQLVEVVIDDEKVLEEFGEPLTFWTWDRQPMAAFMRLASLKPEDTSAIIETVRDLILDEQGKPVLSETNTLPTHVMMSAIFRLTDMLGKY